MADYQSILDTLATIIVEHLQKGDERDDKQYSTRTKGG